MVRESNQPSNQPGSPLLALSAALEPNPEPPTDIESRFAEMKSLGMNKAQIIFMLWQVKKGNSSRYQMASDFYERLAIKYQEINGDSAA
jgi:beta-galactosidase GanA